MLSLFKILYSNSKQSNCLYLGWFVPGLIKTGVDMFSSLFNNERNKNSNYNLQKDAQEYQTSERVSSQNYNTSERLAQQQYQTSEREAQNLWSENIYRNYSSPQALAEQYKAAGLNPALAMSGSVGSATSGSGSASGAPSGGSSSGGSAPTPPYTPYQPMSFNFGDMGNFLKSIADAKKAGVETDFMLSTFDDLVNRNKLENTSIELQNIAQEYYNSVTSCINNKKTAMEVEKLVVEITNGTATLDQIRATTRKLGLESDLLTKQNGVFMQQYEAALKNLRADTESKEASAASSRADVPLKHAQAQSALSTVRLNNSISALNEIDERTRGSINDAILAKYGKEFDKLSSDIQESVLRQFNQRLKNANLSKHGSEQYGTSMISDVVKLFGESMSNVMEYTSFLNPFH